MFSFVAVIFFSFVAVILTILSRSQCVSIVYRCMHYRCSFASLSSRHASCLQTFDEFPSFPSCLPALSCAFFPSFWKRQTP
jgi:hypothetical protein